MFNTSETRAESVKACPDKNTNQYSSLRSGAPNTHLSSPLVKQKNAVNTAYLYQAHGASRAHRMKESYSLQY